MKIALHFSMITGVRIFFVLASVLFIFRTLLRQVGHAYDIILVKRFEIFVTLMVSLCGYLATQKKIYLVLGAFTLLLPRIFFLKKRTSTKIFEIITQYLDQILMNMRAGMSFETAHRSIQAPDLCEKWFVVAKKQQSDLTNGQDDEMISVLRVCHGNPSQTFKILSAYRSSIRLQNRLQQKKDAMTLQARVQAGVSASLFVLLFCAQWYLHPGFKDYLSSSAGKLGLSMSLVLLIAGVVWVFRLSRPTEFEL